MKFLSALTVAGMACALCACGTYNNPCGTGTPGSQTCPPQSSSSSSSGSSSSSSSSGSSSGGTSAAQTGFSIAGATYFDTARQAAASTQPLRGTGRRVGAAGVWQASDAAQAPDSSVVLALSPDAGASSAQLEISRSGWRYQDRLAGALVPVAQGDFTPALSAGTEYWFDLSVAADNRTVTITVPGETRSLEDPDVAALLGTQALWQEQVGQGAGKAFDFVAVWAAEDGQPTVPAAVYEPYNP
jgi:hypothetical protein